MSSVEDAENFLFDHLWHGKFALSADVKAAAAEYGIPPTQLWRAQKPRGLVPLEILDIGFPRRTAWRLEPYRLAAIKRYIAEVGDGEGPVEDLAAENNCGMTASRGLE